MFIWSWKRFQKQMDTPITPDTKPMANAGGLSSADLAMIDCQVGGIAKEVEAAWAEALPITQPEVNLDVVTG